MIYLASPYSHPDPDVRRWRYDMVSQLTVKLLLSGEHIFCPIAYSHPLADRFHLCGSWQFWERLDLAFLDRCDELWIYQLPGWDKSLGVQAEIAHAQGRKMPIKYREYEETPA